MSFSQPLIWPSNDHEYICWVLGNSLEISYNLRETHSIKFQSSYLICTLITRMCLQTHGLSLSNKILDKFHKTTRNFFECNRLFFFHFFARKYVTMRHNDWLMASINFCRLIEEFYYLYSYSDMYEHELHMFVAMFTLYYTVHRTGYCQHCEKRACSFAIFSAFQIITKVILFHFDLCACVSAFISNV